MEALQKQWQNLLARLDRLSRRERMQLLVTLLVLCGAGWNQLAFEPFKKERTRIVAQRAQVEKGLGEMERLEQEILARKDKDPDQLEREKGATLKREIEELDRQLGDGVMGMVSPREMIQALKSLLAVESGLSLVSLEVPPPKNLLEGGDSGAKVYQHTLVMRFSGSFADVLKYLHNLERLPWKLFWDSVQFVVESHPRAYVTLKLHTLSLSADLVGAES